MRAYCNVMSSSAPTKKAHAPNTSPRGTGLLAWISPFFTTSVGMKVTTAITGTLLTGFVIAHFIGNLKVFNGPDSINAYAKFMKDQGPLLWIARGVLLAVFLLHITLALVLKKRAKAARPVPYYNPTTIQASWASRTMPWTGLLILAFVLFHLAHYTVCAIDTIPARSEHTNKVIQSNYLDLIDAQGRQDVYSMVVHAFQKEWVVAVYLVAMVFLFIHLSHGVASVFQTLGLNTPRFQATAKKIALSVAAFVALGNTGIVLGVYMGQAPVDTTASLKTRAGAEDVVPLGPPGPPDANKQAEPKAKNAAKGKGK